MEAVTVIVTVTVIVSDSDCDYSAACVEEAPPLPRQIKPANCGLCELRCVIAVELKKFRLFAVQIYVVYFYSLWYIAHTQTHTHVHTSTHMLWPQFVWYSLGKFSILLSCCDGYLMKCNFISPPPPA